MIGYEAIDVLQEALKDTPFWKFVQPLFGGANVFSEQVSADVAGDPSTHSEDNTESYKVADISYDEVPYQSLDTIEQNLSENLKELRTVKLGNGYLSISFDNQFTQSDLDNLIYRYETLLKSIETVQQGGISPDEVLAVETMRENAANLQKQAGEIIKVVTAQRQIGAVI